MTPTPTRAMLAFEAIENNDQARLMMSLAKGLDPNERDASGRTLLIRACQGRGDRHALVDTLMERGADPGIIGPNGRTALHELCDKPTQNLLTLEMLLDCEVALNQRDETGQTPLHALAARGWLEGCMALLDSCPTPKGLCNQPDARGQTPLFLAADHAATACLLVSYGADPRIEDEHGQSALQRVSDPQARAMLLMQARALSVAEAAQTQSAGQPDREFSDLMGHGKVVLARQCIAEATGRKQPWQSAERGQGPDGHVASPKP